MTNKRIRKKKLKKSISEGSPQTVKDALTAYVDPQTFDSKSDFITYLNSLVTILNDCEFFRGVKNGQTDLISFATTTKQLVLIFCVKPCPTTRSVSIKWHSN
jgi:hypothetical protein